MKRNLIKKSITKIFKTLDEAQYYQIIYGGFIHSISQYEYIKDVDDADVLYRVNYNETRKVYVL